MIDTLGVPGLFWDHPVCMCYDIFKRCLYEKSVSQDDMKTKKGITEIIEKVR